MDDAGKTTLRARPTPTVEDYLTILYILERDGEEVIAARLAEALEVAPPTVTVTLKRMQRDGYVRPRQSREVEGEGRARPRQSREVAGEGRARPRGVQLTEAGREAARDVLRRHMLAEWLLSRMLNIPWSRIHSEAHNLEHTISAEIETHMRDNLNDPQTCPHGNPLPGYEQVTAGWLPLTELKPGQRIILRRIHELAEDNEDLIAYLEANRLFPGAQAEVSEVLDFNQTVTLQVAGQPVTFGFATARYLFAEIL
jgi:DtxR family Mn-dependent transcriptional regulator